MKKSLNVLPKAVRKTMQEANRLRDEVALVEQEWAKFLEENSFFTETPVQLPLSLQRELQEAGIAQSTYYGWTVMEDYDNLSLRTIRKWKADLEDCYGEYLIGEDILSPDFPAEEYGIDLEEMSEDAVDEIASWQEFYRALQEAEGQESLKELYMNDWMRRTQKRIEALDELVVQCKDYLDGMTVETAETILKNFCQDMAEMLGEDDE